MSERRAGSSGWWGAGLVVLGLLLVGWFVWPTPWESLGPEVRRHRVTGRTEVLLFDTWVHFEVMHGLE